MGFITVFFIGLAVFIIVRIFLHKIGVRIDHEAYTGFFVVIFVIVLIVSALHDFSQQARIHHMREAQHRTCQKAGHSDAECKKLVYLK